MAAFALVLLAACSILRPTPQLVRDGADHFTPQAQADAEARLRALSDQHDVLLFVISERNGDPPRMLDAPMADAAADGRPAMAILIVDGRLAGTGYSEEIDDRFHSFAPPGAADRLFADGDPDGALDVIVRSYGAWARDPKPHSR